MNKDCDDHEAGIKGAATLLRQAASVIKGVVWCVTIV